jgi:hypothetical protein
MNIPPTSSHTLLDYTLRTTPDPLQVSPAPGNISYGTLAFIVSNGGAEPVNLAALQFTLPIGAAAQDLASDAAAIIPQALPANAWNVSTPTPGGFLFVPESGEPLEVGADGLLFQFYNIPVNQQLGTFAVQLAETASTGDAPPETRDAVFAAAKFPYSFSFGNFTPQVPMVKVGESVTLTWQGSDDATYELYYGDVQENVTDVRSLTVTGLTDDTTFLLRASVVVEGATVTRDLTTTVVVADPQLVASTLEVSGQSTFNGNVQINNGTPPTGQLTVGYNPSLVTALLGNTNVQGSLVVGVPSGSLTVNGTTTLQGGVSAFKPPVVLEKPHIEKPITYQATCDGLVVGHVFPPDELLCWGYIAAVSYDSGGVTEMMKVTATGGSMSPGERMRHPYLFEGSLCLPVAKGLRFQIQRWHGAGWSGPSFKLVECTFHFVPIGLGTAERVP